MNEELGPVNPNLLYPLSAKEARTVALIERITVLDHDHAVEFARLYYYEIRTSPGGAEGLLKVRFPNLRKP